MASSAISAPAQMRKAQRPTQCPAAEMGWVGRGVGAIAAGAAAREVYRRLTLPGSTGQARLERRNHNGEPVTLAQGPATVVGTLVGLGLTPGLSARTRGAAILATGAAGLLGAYDDLWGTPDAKGLGGHLAALRRGEVTSGTVKIVGIGTTGMVAGVWSRGGRGGVVDAALATVVVAGSANLLNLFDLRPGRAAKVFLVFGTPTMLAGHSLLTAPVVSTVSLLPNDLAARSMLGDTGANALGAVLGVAATSSFKRSALAATAAIIVGLTLVSERVSFTEVIDSSPTLRFLDAWGRPTTS